ncbi:MAG: Phage terminase, large subunit [uncultured Gemmatimonadetes bacterium]|uniref:Phage terminase, large subunit n=1 Tax=uncultured Gemmatimonadota bacterium TaxID=203437 RepID=A0A6J4MR21_9BACT|nr:MAG: Phage terminase, large subunit [uncultured Gemmatimonadota bacterium]
MAVLVVPSADEAPWPTLGPAVCEFLESRAVHGPGDLKGKPYRLDDEKRAFIFRAYEVYPRGHPRAGKRRFKRFGLSLRKGTAKTELAAAVAFAELHGESPVRCDGWRRVGRRYEPVGRPVTDPYVPMVAYTEEQTEDLAYAALYVMCSEGPDADLFDIGLDRILRLDDRGRADGKAVALASSPDARDGARTTFQHFDETHRFTLHRLVRAHETMLQNIPKRMGADPWSLETTTTYTPGEGSVAEATHEEAEQIARGAVSDPTFFFFHREAAPDPDESLDDPETLRVAIREASGPSIAGWDDFDGQVENIASLYQQAKRRGNSAYFERVWLNRRVQGNRKAFDATRWADLAEVRQPEERSAIALGLDGSKWRDTTALVATEMATGWQWLAGFWDPADLQDGEVPTDEVEALCDDLFARHEVARMYGDPAQGFDILLARLASRHGARKVAEFYTDSRGLRSTAYAMRSYGTAMRSGEVQHSDDEVLNQHIGNAHRRDIRMLDDDGQPLWVIEKERRDSPFKIDAAMAGGLSWQARTDALSAGFTSTPTDNSVLVFRR